MKIRWKQTLQKLHLPNGHVSAKMPGSRPLSLLIGHFDAGTYKSTIKKKSISESPNASQLNNIHKPRE